MAKQEEKKTYSCPCGEFVYEKEGWDKEAEHKWAMERKQRLKLIALRRQAKRREDGRLLLMSFLLGALGGMVAMLVL